MSVIYRVVIAVAAGVIVLVIFVLGAVAAPAQDLGFVTGAVFDRLDSNGDGILSKQEVTSARDQVFAGIDTDRNGVVTLAEIEAAKVKAKGIASGDLPASRRFAPRCKRRASALPRSIGTMTARFRVRSS